MLHFAELLRFGAGAENSRLKTHLFFELSGKWQFRVPRVQFRDKKIEGILARGLKDFELTPAGCNTRITYSSGGYLGQEVTKIS